MLPKQADQSEASGEFDKFQCTEWPRQRCFEIRDFNAPPNFNAPGPAPPARRRPAQAPQTAPPGRGGLWGNAPGVGSTPTGAPALRPISRLFRGYRTATTCMPPRHRRRTVSSAGQAAESSDSSDDSGDAEGLLSGQRSHPRGRGPARAAVRGRGRGHTTGRGRGRGGFRPPARMTSTLAEGGFDSMLHGCPRSYMRTEASYMPRLTWVRENTASVSSWQPTWRNCDIQYRH